MNAIVIALVTFAFTFGGAWLATFIRPRLPESHLGKDSQDVIRLGMGLVATMTALLLGLVTAAAKGTFDGQDAAIRASAVNILTLDRHLARYGPETAAIRDLLRRSLAFRIEATWGNSVDPTTLGFSAAETTVVAEEIQNQILALVPASDTQRWFKTEALKLTEEVVKTRWRLVTSRGGAVPRTFLVVVICWLMATFASFGLYAPRNATVLGVLLLAALSVAAAVFLILELDGPLTGLIKISSEPLRYALANIGH